MFQAVRTIARRQQQQQQQQHHQLQQRLSPFPGWGRAVESTIMATTTTRRTYLSRAHPTKLPEYPVLAALDMVLGETQARAAKRADKWERNKPVRVKKGMEVRGVGRLLACLIVCVCVCVSLSFYASIDRHASLVMCVPPPIHRLSHTLHVLLLDGNNHHHYSLPHHYDTHITSYIGFGSLPKYG